MSEPQPNPIPAPDPLAVALSRLEPAPHGFDRDALMFAAGRATKERAINFWRTLALAALAALIPLAAWLLLR